MTEELFKRYAEIKNDIKALKAEEDVINKTILAELAEQKLEKAEFPFGKFKVMERKSYDYSDKVKVMAEDVKIAQIEEVENGTARVKSTSYLKFNQ